MLGGNIEFQFIGEDSNIAAFGIRDRDFVRNLIIKVASKNGFMKRRTVESLLDAKVFKSFRSITTYEESNIPWACFEKIDSEGRSSNKFRYYVFE